ncbi:phage tail tape measure protein [Bacillus cereus]
MAGWNVQQILKGTEPILKLSEAGNLDLARASDLVTDSMSALGITVDDLPRYLDVMAQTSRKSNTDIDALGEAFLRVGGTFRD